MPVAAHALASELCDAPPWYYNAAHAVLRHGPFMTLTVRLPPRIEQELAEYCVKRRITRSEAVKQALEELLASNARKPSAYDLGKDLFGPHTDVPSTADVARHSKRLLREHFRGKKVARRRAPAK